MEIIKSLNLNVTPKDAPNGSLVYARNVMTDDTSSFLTNDIGFTKVLDFGVFEDSKNEKICGIIPCNNEIVVLTYTSDSYGNVDKSYVYLFKDSSLPLEENVDITDYRVGCNWKYNLGKINGTYTYDYKHRLIIAIAESEAYYYSQNGIKKNIDIPLKSFNVDTCSFGDKITYAIEEEIPFYDCSYSINHDGRLVCGTYTFFIRFKLDEYNYTKWFPITSEIFITNHVETANYIHSYLEQKTDTTQDPPELYDIEANKIYESEMSINKDGISDKTIVLKLQFKNVNIKKLQLGYIIKRKTDIQARIKNDYEILIDDSGKNGSLVCNVCDNRYISEESIDSLLDNPNQKFNVKAITNYNNRLYIGNYKEYNIEDYSNLSKLTNVTSTQKAEENNGIENIDDDEEEYAPQQTIIKTTVSFTITRIVSVKLKTDFTEVNEEDLFTIYPNQSGNPGVVSQYIIKEREVSDITIPNLYYAIDTDYLNTTSKDKFITELAKSFKKGRATLEHTLYEGVSWRDCYLIVQSPNQTTDYVCIYVNEADLENGQDRYTHPGDWNWDVNVPQFDIKCTSDELSIVCNNKTYVLWSSNKTVQCCRTSVLEYGILMKAEGQIPVSRYIYGVIETEEGSRFNSDKKLVPEYTISDFKVISIPAGGGTIDEDEDNNEDIEGHSVTIDYNRTLIPYQKYNFYIHYIRRDGSVTLGYPIGIYGYKTIYGNKIVPNFEVLSSNFPNGYVGYFISYEDVELNSNCVYILSNEDNTYLITNPEYVYDLNSIFGNKIRTEENKNGELIDGALTKFIRDGLNCNRVKIYPYNSINTAYSLAFLTTKIPEQYTNKVKTLFRLTKNIYELDKLISDDDYLPGFFSGQYIINYGGEYIISPVSSYVYDGITGNKTTYTPSIIFENYYSFYPLFAMNIKEEFVSSSIVLTTLKHRGSNNVEQVNNLVINRIMPPSLLNNFLELQAGYYDKPSKVYTNYRENLTSTFNKTIARSNVVSDESLTNSFRQFNPNQYKNIFENKGNITNIVGIGLYLIIHTEHSIFVFDRSPKLSQYAKTEIPDTFDVEYQELMPTNEGYGGLLDREESIITKHGYFWYDKTNKIIFSFEQGKPSIISSAINNYIKQLPIETCRFAEDILHNRLIVCFKLNGEKYITLSYNLNTKQFISFHDYKFTYNYKTYGKSYLFDESIENRNKLFVFDDRVPINYDDLGIAIGIDSGERYNVGDDTNNAGTNPSIIDIIFNEEFEVPKVLNSINYVLSKFNHNDAVYLPQILREYDDRLFPGDYIKIYTDEIITDVINVKDTKQNVNDYETYTKPKWEKGKWNLNYFRDIHHVNEEIGYTSDQESLVFGKYFVVRFIFENNVNNPTRFKLDNVNVNFELY